MIVHVDTSALIDALTGPRRSLRQAHRNRPGRSSAGDFQPRVFRMETRSPYADPNSPPRKAFCRPSQSSRSRLQRRRWPRISIGGCHGSRGREIDLAIAACAHESRCGAVDAQSRRLRRRARTETEVIGQGRPANEIGSVSFPARPADSYSRRSTTDRHRFGRTHCGAECASWPI